MRDNQLCFSPSFQMMCVAFRFISMLNFLAEFIRGESNEHKNTDIENKHFEVLNYIEGEDMQFGMC